MTDLTKDQTLAAVSTPIRDLRDEVWVRVYAYEYSFQRGQFAAPVAAERAAVTADLAVKHMPIPAHRRAEVGLS